LVLELADQGDLDTALEELGPLDQANSDDITDTSNLWAVHIAYQMIETVYLLHNVAGIVHRDLKPANFLLRSSGILGRPLLKLTDFGLACAKRDRKCLAKLCGTLAYSAPEIVNGGLHNFAAGMAADIFGLGATLYILFFNVWPESNAYAPRDFTIEVLNDPVTLKPRPPNFDPVCLEMIKQMMDPEPDKRVKSAQMMRHPCVVRMREQLGMDGTYPDRVGQHLDLAGRRPVYVSTSSPSPFISRKDSLESLKRPLSASLSPKSKRVPIGQSKVVDEPTSSSRVEDENPMSGGGGV